MEGISNKMIRSINHLALWGGLMMLYIFQNPDSGFWEFLSFFEILTIAAVVVYVNLYLLLPKYFFKKTMVLYIALLFLTITVASYIVAQSFENLRQIGSVPVFAQNVINLFMIVLLTSSLKFLRENQRGQIRINHLKNLQLQSELSLLKSQINPHFLFNSLNNLYGLILQEKNKMATETILKLSELMRYILDSSKLEKISMEEEIRFISNYLDLEKIRLSQEVDIKFEVSQIEGQQIYIPPLFFITMVENAFKHGVEHHTQSCFVYISLCVQGNGLYFEVENSISTQPLKKERKLGMGLINLRKRLEILYPDKHSLTIQENTGIYKIVLFLSL